MHLIHTGRAPQYLVDSVQSVTTSSQRHLRSSEATDYVKEQSSVNVALATLAQQHGTHYNLIFEQ